MKRMICLLLAGFICLGGFGCTAAQTPSAETMDLPEPTPAAAETPAPSDAPESPAQEPAAEEPSVGLPNPMVEYESLEAVQAVLGVYMTVPYQSADVEYFVIGDTLAHIAFTYEGVSYVLRAQKTEAFEDISGVYADMTVTRELEWAEQAYTLSYIEGELGLSQWYDSAAGFSYSIFMESGATEEALATITESVIPAG